MENSNEIEIKKQQKQFALLSLLSTPIFILLALSSMAYFSDTAMFEFLEDRNAAFMIMVACGLFAILDFVLAYKITMSIKSLEDGNT